MIIKEASLTRREIEARLAKVGDYVKMDYLQACLKRNLDFDTKKYALTTLAAIYESRRMFLEAGKMTRAAAEINTTFEGKMSDFMKSMQLFIAGGNFEEAEISFAKALACSDGMQKERIKLQRREAYKKQAQEYFKKDKRKHAMETFERLLNLTDLTPNERRETQVVLLGLYEKLGKITEYDNLRRTMQSPQRPQALPRPEPSPSIKPSDDFDIDRLLD